MSIEQRREFMDFFYELSEIDDRESVAPWGCPWDYCPQRELFGDDIAEMAQEYYEEVREQMVEASEIEE